MNRVHVTKTILWMLTGLALAVALTRFAFGLGVTTNLTDTTPWGLWIGFDVMAGVALGAGGFVITAIFYILRQEKFHPLVRPAVLTALLGYIAVILSLLVDLGLPWNIWHMMIYWNPHSPLFEVGWCVMLYTTVLLLEFSPVPLAETSRWANIRRVLMKFRFPLVLLGIMLSTLHQSSLGSLFLITPFKSYPLWYTPLLPILFFISAIALGLMMVSFESLCTSWLYRRPAENNLVARLGSAARWVLGFYLLVRLLDLKISGNLALIFSGNWESWLFIAELLIMAIIPIILFSIPRVRHSATGQWIGSFLVVAGTILNRVNVGGLTMVGTTGEYYFPSWMEVSISAGIVAALALVFLFAIEKFQIWETRPREPESDPHVQPAFSRGGQTWLGSPSVAGRTRYSLAFIIAVAIGFALIPAHKIDSSGVVDIVAARALGGDTLFVDGNRDGFGVAFPHAAHIKAGKGKESCVGCHHMNLPLDRQSGCYSCHRGMYLTADAFGHDWHASAAGGNVACVDCHTRGEDRTAATARPCADCHKDLMPEGAAIKVNTYTVPSYADAMHDLCIPCHRQAAATNSDHPDLYRCPTCHNGKSPDWPTLAGRQPWKRRLNNHNILPVVSAGIEGPTP